jgi:hypothetical protein
MLVKLSQGKDIVYVEAAAVTGIGILDGKVRVEIFAGRTSVQGVTDDINEVARRINTAKEFSSPINVPGSSSSSILTQQIHEETSSFMPFVVGAVVGSMISS